MKIFTLRKVFIWIILLLGLRLLKTRLDQLENDADRYAGNTVAINKDMNDQQKGSPPKPMCSEMRCEKGNGLTRHLSIC